MVLNKWGVAILQFIIFILTTYTVLNTDGMVTVVEWWQFGGLFVAQVGVIIVPLAQGGYAAILKVSVATGGALFSAVVVIIDTANGGPGWTSGSFIVVALAVANAVAVHFGVDARLDAAKAALAESNPRTIQRQGVTIPVSQAVEVVDPKAALIAERQVVG